MYNKILLDYSLDSLEPVIDSSTMDIHYNKIYMKYLNNLNSLLKSINYDFSKSLLELINNIDSIPLSIRGEVLYNLGGLLNHNLYFYEISDKANNRPIGNLEKDINLYFGSFNNFKNEFVKSANEVVGSGYTFLVLDRDKKLKIINTSNQDSPYSYGYTPVMNIDLWEHAYFLKYKNDRSKYIENFFNILDFNKLENYYNNIKKYNG